jgi:hypothetical protein
MVLEVVQECLVEAFPDLVVVLEFVEVVQEYLVEVAVREH